MSESCPVCGAALDANASECGACGFKRLDTTQRFKPLIFEDEHSDENKTAAKTPHATLRVLKGPQTGIAFTLEGAHLVVGRNPNCDIFLNDMTVSRSHAIIEQSGNDYVITDDNSFNGVWVNNKNVESHVLVSGDIVQIGAFCLLYQGNN